MAFLNRIFHRDGNYDSSPPIHIIYPAREAYQMPIDYTGTGSSQWQPQQQPYGGFGQPMQPGMGAGMMPQQQQQMGFGGMQPMQQPGGIMQQGGFPGQQMGMPFGGGQMMGGGGQHQGCPQLQPHQHQGMTGGMQGGFGGGDPNRVVIPGQHGVLVIEGPNAQQQFQQGMLPGGQHQMGQHGPRF